MEVLNYSHKSYSGRHGSNVLDASLSVICDTDTQPFICKFYGAFSFWRESVC